MKSLWKADLAAVFSLERKERRRCRSSVPFSLPGNDKHCSYKSFFIVTNFDMFSVMFWFWINLACIFFLFLVLFFFFGKHTNFILNTVVYDSVLQSTNKFVAWAYRLSTSSSQPKGSPAPDFPSPARSKRPSEVPRTLLLGSKMHFWHLFVKKLWSIELCS